MSCLSLAALQQGNTEAFTNALEAARGARSLAVDHDAIPEEIGLCGVVELSKHRDFFWNDTARVRFSSLRSNKRLS
jgi:hypothetical protein